MLVGQGNGGETVKALSMLSAILLVSLCYNVSLASIGGSHTCSSADGEYTIDFYFDPAKALRRRGSDTTQAFKILTKVLLEKTTKICKSNSSNEMLYQYKITAERYLIQIDGAVEGKMFMYCESYLDPSPANACDSNAYDRIIEHKVLDPRYK
jgi:hypothetical protein